MSDLYNRMKEIEVLTYNLNLLNNIKTIGYQNQ